MRNVRYIFFVIIFNFLAVKTKGLIVFFGFILSFIFFIVGLFYLIFKLLNWTSFETGVAPLVIGLFFISSFIVLVLGIIGEYLIVLMNYSKKIPNVIEEERINFE